MSTNGVPLMYQLIKQECPLENCNSYLFLYLQLITTHFIVYQQQAQLSLVFCFIVKKNVDLQTSIDLLISIVCQIDFPWPPWPA